MLSKENIEGQVTDNQMGYIDTELTIGAKGGFNHEDRLSSGELQYGRSQESPRVTRCSNSVWYSVSNDTANGVSLTDDEVTKKATFFVKTFVQKFEEEISKLFKEAEPDSKIQKISRTSATINSVVNHTIPPSPLRLILVRVNECIAYRTKGKQHKKAAESISAIIDPGCKGETRKILVEAGLSIFQKFEQQFIKVVNVNTSCWSRGVQKLAMDAVSRIINHFLTFNEEKDLSVNLITKGVVLGESKRKVLFGDAGYKIKDEQGGEILTTSDLYELVGIKKAEGKIVNYYQYNLSEDYDYSKKCNYRLPFAWEVEEWENVEQKYVLSETSGEGYVYIFDEEKKKELASNILKEINGNDPVKKKDIEEACERFENLLINSQKKDVSTFYFNLNHLSEFFIERRTILKELTKKLNGRSQELQMSRMVLIKGEHGVGKSELARSYPYSKESNSNVWMNIICVDAGTYGTLSHSFRSLAKELNISTEARVDSEGQQEREIESIIKDIYKNFRDAKSLFIFDNANEYKEIEKFLPSNFSDLFFGREKPYVLITSSNKNWEEEIEKIELSDGFSLGEAITFIEQTLEIKDRLQNCYLVELAEALNYLPLALMQATSYIKREKLSISKYLEHYNKAMQESNPDYLVAQGISPKLFTALKVNFDKIKGEKNIGQQSCKILTAMAYLSPNQIDIVEIFLRKKSEKDKQQVLDAFDLLNKFSMIELKKSIAKIHRGIQKTIRVEEERAGTEEETLREVITSLVSNGVTNVSHIISVWSHVSKYKRLVNEFINSSCDECTILHLLAKSGSEEIIKYILGVLEEVNPNKLSEVINAADKTGCTSLDYAVMYGHLETVKYLIEKGSNWYGGSGDFSTLHLAAVYNRLEIFKHLIDNEYFEFNWLNKMGHSILYHTIEGDNLDIVKCFVEYIVRKGGNVNLQDGDGESFLYHAAKGNGLDIVKYLIEKGASVDPKNKNIINLLYCAVKDDRLDVIQCLVGVGVGINQHDKYGISPLHCAVTYGHLEIVKYFMKKGASVNPQDENFITLLYCAAKDGILNVAKCLVEIGVDINYRDKCGIGSLHYATMYGHLEIVKYFMEKGSDLYDELAPLHWAAVCGQLEIVKYFIDNEYFELDELSGEDNTPLYYAIKYEHLDIIQYLIKKGANINPQNEDIIGLLYHAIKKGNLDIVKCLIKKGDNVDLYNKCDIGLLHFAVVTDQLEIVQYLIEIEANVNLYDEYDMDPLHYVARDGYLDIAQYLIKKGANVNLCNKDDMSPLHFAAGNCHLNVVKLLIEKGANVNLCNKDDMSPLHFAAESDRLDIVDYLVKKGANINLCDKRGMRPSDYAVESNHSNIVQYLRTEEVNMIPVHGQSQISMRKRLRTPELQDCNLLYSRKDWCISPERKKSKDMIATFRDSYNTINLPLEVKESRSLVGLWHKLAPYPRQMISKQLENSNSQQLADNVMPISLLSSIAVESVNNKNLKGSN